MDIQIVEQAEALQVVIKCRQVDEEIIRLKNHIGLFDKKLAARKDGEYHFIHLSDILYFESVDNRTFLYTHSNVMEIGQRLYELEYILSDKDFVRISKSLIANINKIASLKPELNRTILATSHIFHYDTISINTLTKIVCFTIGGVFIFCVVFTRLFIKKWSFMARLTCFMLSISLYECADFYWIGIFAGKGTIIQWLTFVGILFILYFVSIAVYQRHSIKQGILYTQALQKYQEQRRTADEG